MLLTFDTETTGIYNFKSKMEDPAQPNLVQLAWCMAENVEDEDLEWRNLIIYPENWDVPPAATAIHGISTNRAKTEGIPLEDALLLFTDDLNKTKTIIAHNLNFDLNVMKSVFYRKGIAFPSLDGKNRFCTMLSSMNILKIPASWGNGYKWPRLDESYRFLVDEYGFEGAHDALNDVRACWKVYLKLMERREKK